MFEWISSKDIIVRGFIHLLGIVGAVIVLGDMLQWFVSPERTEFVKIIASEHKCSADHTGAAVFIDEYVYKKAPNLEGDDRVSEVIYTGLFTAVPGQKPDANIGGSIKVRSIGGKVSKSLCTFEELKSWSKDTLGWRWFGWSLLVFGILLNLIIYFTEIAQRHND
ncbi:hypothetical protein OAC89_04255 [Deltaproteobacteria bacterium]|nr:hypothetical protein [Deltaproteobacteria bacterium]